MLNRRHLRGFLLRPRENHPDSSAYTLLTLDLQIGFQIIGAVLNDGKTQTGATQLLGVALVHPIKPLEHPTQLLLRDANAGVAHLNHRTTCSV